MKKMFGTIVKYSYLKCTFIIIEKVVMSVTR